MLDPAFGHFDYVVAMDSLIHYEAADAVSAIGALGARTARALCVTIAPRTPALAVRHAIGRLFPRSSRAPAIAPLSTARLSLEVADRLGAGFRIGRTTRVSAGFYVSQALEVVRIDGRPARTQGGAA
jgi:magnesium-protoporphyrin O-methyltransferase